MLPYKVVIGISGNFVNFVALKFAAMYSDRA
jgi:hypothetical protein